MTSKGTRLPYTALRRLTVTHHTVDTITGKKGKIRKIILKAAANEQCVVHCPRKSARYEWRLLIIISRESKWGTLKSAGNPRCAVSAEIHSTCTDCRDLGPATGLQVSPTSDTCQSVAILMNRRHCVSCRANNYARGRKDYVWFQLSVSRPRSIFRQPKNGQPKVVRRSTSVMKLMAAATHLGVFFCLCHKELQQTL